MSIMRMDSHDDRLACTMHFKHYKTKKWQMDEKICSIRTHLKTETFGSSHKKTANLQNHNKLQVCSFFSKKQKAENRTD